MALTAKQQSFCKEYIIDLNATQAAIRAGYSEKTAYSIGDENLKKPDIKAFIQEMMNERSKRTEITADKVLKELASIGFSNIDDFVNVIEIQHERPVYGADEHESFEPEIVKQKVVDVRLTKDVSKSNIAAISSIKQGKEGIEIKLHDKVKSLELIGRHLGMFKDNIIHSGDPSNPVQTVNEHRFIIQDMTDGSEKEI